ncbi:MAG TPA: hypothetical protein VFW78_10455 [Bacteroidia bacterium]|nr:hypothetical protein [Bacteroidia bacterium]
MTNTTFDLQMNPMVRNLLVSAIGTCKFAMMHKEHPVTRAIHEFKLFEGQSLEHFLERIKAAKDGQKIKMSIKDEVLIYAAMDLTCKIYLTDLGDKMEQLSKPVMKEGKSSYIEIRSTLLKGCQFVMEGMREKLSGIDAFDDLVEILDNYLIFD